MDYGTHVYYFACPAEHCGGIYRVCEVRHFARDDEAGMLVCPYCGWILQTCPEVSTMRAELEPSEQAAIRAALPAVTGRIDTHWLAAATGRRLPR